eukprot:TRINITY_DN29928_c0_g1_i1.p1 TRINITY_DN29928_c0_g1~~TRINITY_DN29928_c0_g1_i1.p1  ORF type:complete len:172 (+),score=1.86 TRINITY_DN29928_c0_g1_i1:200-715(+)
MNAEEKHTEWIKEYALGNMKVTWQLTVNTIPALAREYKKLLNNPKYRCSPLSPGKEWAPCNLEEYHVNTVYWDQDKDIMYLNAKMPATFWAIQRSSPKGQGKDRDPKDKEAIVLWGCGPMGDLRIVNEPAVNLAHGSFKQVLSGHWIGSHEVTPINDTHFVLYDNGVEWAY